VLTAHRLTATGSAHTAGRLAQSERAGQYTVTQKATV